jgi:hypothetical protein
MFRSDPVTDFDERKNARRRDSSSPTIRTVKRLSAMALAARERGRGQEPRPLPPSWEENFHPDAASNSAGLSTGTPL